MEGLIMRLEYLNRSFANLDRPHTDEIMLLIGEAISCMSRDRPLSLEFDGENFPHLLLCISIIKKTEKIYIEKGWRAP